MCYHVVALVKCMLLYMGILCDCFCLYIYQYISHKLYVSVYGESVIGTFIRECMKEVYILILAYFKL
jgi:hypothetical protein